MGEVIDNCIDELVAERDLAVARAEAAEGEVVIVRRIEAEVMAHLNRHGGIAPDRVPMVCKKWVMGRGVLLDLVAWGTGLDSDLRDLDDLIKRARAAVGEG